MADKRISQLIERVDIANNDVLPIVASGASTTNKVTISTIQDWMQSNLDVGVTSVGITIGTSGNDVNVTGSPITTSGNITINIPTASATNRGLLSAADWSTFNAKQPAGNYVTIDTTQTITAHKTFTASGGQPSITINHSSGAGHALDITKAGNGEGIRVNKTSGSGNAITVIGANIEVLGNFVKTGGTSSQFLKADGSVDSSTYVTTDTSQAITATKQFTQGLSLGSAGGTNQLTVVKNIGTIHEGSAGSNIFGFNNSNNIYFGKGLNNGGVISWNNAAVRYYTLPDADGTLALTSQIPANPVGGTGTTNQIPKFSGTSTLTNSNISDNGTEVNIQSRVFVTSGGEQFVFSPNLGGTSNRIETLGGLPLEITTDGSSIGMNVGGGSSQFSMTNIGASFFVPVSSNGQAATSPAFIANNSTGTSGTAQHYINFTAGTTNIARMLRGNGASGLAENGLNIDNFGGFGIRLNQLGGSGGTFSVSGGAATFSNSVTIQAGNSLFVQSPTTGRIGSLTTTIDGTVLSAHNGSGEPLILSSPTGSIIARTGGTDRLTIASTGAATFSSSVTAVQGNFFQTASSGLAIQIRNRNANQTWGLVVDTDAVDDKNLGIWTGSIYALKLNATSGAATFSSSVKGKVFLPAFAASTLANQNSGIVWTNGTIGDTFGFVVQDGVYYQGDNNNANNTFGVRAATSDGSIGTPIFVVKGSGNVGIGTASPSEKLHVDGGNIIVNSAQAFGFGDRSAQIVGNTGASGFLRFDTNNGERMRITSGGDVLVGGISSSTYSNTGRVAIVASGASQAILGLVTGGVNKGYMYSDGTNITLMSEDASGYMRFGTNNTERMRITSGGAFKASNTGDYASSTAAYHELRQGVTDTNIAVLTNTTASPYGPSIVFTGAAPNNSTNYFLLCSDTSTNRFIVYSNGNVANTNGSYGAISDIKLKENIEDATPKLDDLMKVKVRNYNLIGDDKKQIGVIAQELEEVFPAMIDESEDFEEVEVPQVDEEGNEILNEEGEVVTTKERVSKGTTTKSVKYSVFVPMLIKAMQEQQEQIKSLTEQVEALKSQING